MVQLSCIDDCENKDVSIDNYLDPLCGFETLPHFVPTITGHAACLVDWSGSPDFKRLNQNAAVPCAHNRNVKLEFKPFQLR